METSDLGAQTLSQGQGIREAQGAAGPHRNTGVAGAPRRETLASTPA